jgi:flotillin
VPNLFNFVGGGPLVVFLAIVILVLLVAYLGSRYKVAAANEALIVSGRREKGLGGEQRLKVVRGQGTIVLPLLHRVGRLKLTARQINVNLADAVSRQGIKVAVQGVATFKIGADDESIQNAAERFLDSKEDEVDSIVKNVLEGSLRSIVGTLTIEELNLDRMKFQQAVQDAAKGDLATSGLQIDSFTIQAIRDESGYMDLIGQQETARRERDARMAKASADQEAAVREAEAEQVKINAQRDVSLRRAETLTQIAAADARAAQAGPLAEAEARQEVTRRETELAELAAARTQKELLATTVRPAEADAEAQIRRAEGDKGARIAQAQADAERVKLAGQAEASVTVTKGEAQARVVAVNAEAEAKRTTLEGNAEAGIVFTKGEAEAKALELRAQAYKQFNEAAIIQTVLSMLPAIVRAASEPMASIGSLTVISSDGASEVVRTTTRTVAEASAAVKGLTGIDVPALLGSALGGSPAAPAQPAATRARKTEGGSGGGGPAGGGASGGGGTPAPRQNPPASSAPSGASPAASTDGAAEDAVAAFARAAEAMSRTTAAQAAATAAAMAGASAIPAPAATPAATPAPAAPAPGRATPAPSPAGSPSSRTDRAAEPPRPAPGLGAPSAAQTRQTLAERAEEAVARELAERLRRVPGIERFGGVTLGELEASGPRSLQNLWRTARGQLEDRYRDVTIGQILDRFGGGEQGPGQALRP